MPLPSIEICIPHRAVYLAAQPIFDSLQNVNVSHESVVSGEHEALITFGNSFDCVNKPIRLLFGDDIENRVKTLVKERLGGKMAVGQAIVVPVDHPKHKWLIYAPIVQLPYYVTKLPNAAHLAFRGALAAMREAGITAASTPLFCDELGFTSVVRAARQMRAALESVVNQNLVGGDWNHFHSNDVILRDL
jgi:O-acetyl-ADP-ribose deacetylase (regulator of RNase III)